MANTGLTELLQVQYTNMLKLMLQQEVSFLRSRCEEGTHTGARLAAPINLVRAITMKTPEGRFAPKVVTPNEYQRRWVAPTFKEVDQYVSPEDELQTPIDPKSKLVMAAASAVGVAFDDEIIRAATADAVVGADAGSLSTEVFDLAKFRIADNFGTGGAAVGLTVAKLNEARRILEKYHNTMEMSRTAPTLVISSSQHADLRNQAHVVSSDFNQNGGVLVDGMVKKFMGFDIVVSERLPFPATNTRGCLAFVKSGLYLGIWQDIRTRIAERFELSFNPWDISTNVGFGATRTENGKVVRIDCLDTFGPDINP
jgi:hypothetical protein